MFAIASGCSAVLQQLGHRSKNRVSQIAERILSPSKSKPSEQESAEAQALFQQLFVDEVDTLETSSIGGEGPSLFSSSSSRDN